MNDPAPKRESDARARAFFWIFGYLSLVGSLSWTTIHSGVLIPIGSIVLEFPSNAVIYSLLGRLMTKHRNHLKAWIFTADLLSGALSAAVVFAFFEWRRRGAESRRRRRRGGV